MGRRHRLWKPFQGAVKLFGLLEGDLMDEWVGLSEELTQLPNSQFLFRDGLRFRFRAFNVNDMKVGQADDPVQRHRSSYIRLRCRV